MSIYKEDRPDAVDVGPSKAIASRLDDLWDAVDALQELATRLVGPWPEEATSTDVNTIGLAVPHAPNLRDSLWEHEDTMRRLTSRLHTIRREIEEGLKP